MKCFKEVDGLAKKYYVQKKNHMDKNGVEHTNYTVSLPHETVQELGLDSPDREDRAVEVDFDTVTKTITITKITC